MHFMDPRELGGLHVIGSNGVALGVVDGIYTDIRSGYPQWAAIQSGLFGTDVSIIPLYATEHDNRPAGKAAWPGGRTRAAGRPMLHEYAVSSANRVS
jgi:PRC-barrel domain